MRKRLQILLFSALTLIGMAMLSGPTKAAVVVDPAVGGDFVFGWDAGNGGLGPIDGILVGGVFVAPAIWEMTVVKDSILSVVTATDCCLAGDEFELIFDGATVAWDSVTMLFGVIIPEFVDLGDPNPLDGNVRYAIFNLFLDAGTHSFTLNVTNSVATPGAGLMSFGRAVAVPLPAALPLFGTGLAVFGYLGWRRRRGAAVA